MSYRSKFYDLIAQRLGVDERPEMDIILAKLLDPTAGSILPIGVASNPLSVNVLSSPLITGFATSANQTNGNQLAGIKIYDVLSASYLGLKFADGKPRVSCMPYQYDIAEGNVTGHTAYTKLGYNPDIGATEEDLITQGGVYPWIPAGGIALEIVSSSANDALAGTGVQKTRVTYLDTSYAQQTQTFDMAGVTPVAFTDTHVLRVNSIRATQVGTGGVAAGDIIVRNVGGATVYRQMSAGFTRGRGLTYTVPLGKTLYISSVTVASGSSTAGKVVRWIGRAQVDDTAPTVKINFFQPFFETITQDSPFYRPFESPFPIPATADLKVSAISSGAGAICDCALRGWLE